MVAETGRNRLPRPPAGIKHRAPAAPGLSRPATYPSHQERRGSPA